MTRFSRSMLATAMALAAGLPVLGRAAEPVAAPSTVPASAFFNFADMNEPTMSPDGSAVAVLVRNRAGRRQLAVIETADLHKVKIVASFEEFDIAWAHWADDQSLVFGLGDETESAAEVRGSGLYGQMESFLKANVGAGAAADASAVKP